MLGGTKTELDKVSAESSQSIGKTDTSSHLDPSVPVIKQRVGSQDLEEVVTKASQGRWLLSLDLKDKVGKGLRSSGLHGRRVCV